MNITVEISMYPLDADYKPPIKAFVRRLREHTGLETRTNQMSTQVRGEYAAVMAALTSEIGTTFERVPKAVFAIRILNNPIAG